MDLRAHWQAKNIAGVWERIEIYVPDYNGTPLKLDASGRPFRFQHEEVSRDDAEGVLNPYANNIQRGALQFEPKIQTAAEQQLLEDILGVPRVLIVQLFDDEVFWKGYIDTKRIEYPEEPMFFAELNSTDLDNLSMDYELEEATGRATLIEIIAELLGYLEFDLPIEVATALSYDTINKNESYLHQIYADKANLRNFGNPGEVDTPISVGEALEKLCKGLIVRQMAGKWQIHQIRAFKDPTAVRITRYDSEGKNPVATTENVRQAVGSSTGPLPVFTVASRNGVYAGLRRTKIRFDHRTVFQNIQFPDIFRLDDQEPQRTFTQFLNAGGNEKLRLTGTANAEFDDDINEAEIRVEIEADGLWWNNLQQEWQSTFYAIPLEMIDTTLSEGKIGFQRIIDIQTTELPSTVSGDLNITLYTARNNDEPRFADFTDYEGLDFTILNPTVEEGNNTAIDYQLTQVNPGYKVVLDMHSAWFGDGPTSYARSAFTTNEAGTQLTTNLWGYDTFDNDYFKAVLKEPLDLQRDNTRRFVGNSPRNYDPAKVSFYRGMNLYYVGGRYTGQTAEWLPVVYAVNENTAEDKYEVLYKTYDPETGTRTVGGGASAPSQPAPGPGGGITQSEADQRYLIKAENLSDLTNKPLARTELELGVNNDVEFRDIVARAGQFLLPVIVPDAEQGTHALNRQTADGRYDKYNFWHLRVAGNAPEEIEKEDEVHFIEGTGISLTWNSSAKSVTISSTGASANNYLDGIEFNGSQGDDVEVRFLRTGLSPIDFDFRPFIQAWADTRYLTSEQDPTVPQHVKDITQANINTWFAKDNYNHWKAQVDGGVHEEIGSGETLNFEAGDNVSLDYQLSGGNPTVVINATGASTNNYVNSIQFGGQEGDNIVLELSRLGLSTLSLNMTGHMESYLDTVYASISHNQPFSTITGTLSDNQHGSRGGGSLHSNATSSVAGFMSSADKNKLNGVSNNADNYDNWQLQINSGSSITVGSGQMVSFVAGTNISLSRSTRTITINATGDTTNNYVSGMDFGGTEGDDIVLRLQRQGLSQLTLNMTNHMRAYFDTVYESLGVSFSQLSGTLSDNQHGNRSGGNLHSVATTSTNGFMSSSDKSKLNNIESGADNYDRWRVSFGGSTAWINSGQTMRMNAGTGLEWHNSQDSGRTRTIRITSIVARRDQNNTFNGELTSDDYGISSDRRLKTNIDYKFPATELHKKLQFASFTKKGRKGYGVIAQEVQMILPESVKKGPKGFLSVYNTDLIAINGKVIQELTKRIEYLERELYGNSK